jgi:hypothetical protein
MMHLSVESLLFVMYLDSLFAENRTRQVTPLGSVPETLNRLHAQAMREHSRPSVLRFREGAQWRDTPDWRFDRQVIRLGLYLRERTGLEAGERVAIISELTPEWFVADLAAMNLGAASATLDPRLGPDQLATALEEIAPRVTFVSAAAQDTLERLDGKAPRWGELISLDGPRPGTSATAIGACLDMGGTLDTPERAQAFRAAAREIGPERIALRHYAGDAAGWRRVELTQGEIVERLRASWLREPPREGDVAYVSDPAASLTARLAVYGFMGDGYTTTALARGGGEVGDLAALGPAKIVAPAALFAEAAAGSRPGDGRGRSGGWLRRAARLVPRGRAGGAAAVIRNGVGNRARWIATTDSLASALAGRLADIVMVEPDRYEPGRGGGAV